MPRGFQWSGDEIRNAERMAQIQADAIAKAQREAQKRAERLASRRACQSRPVSSAPTRTYQSSPRRCKPSPFANLSVQEFDELCLNNRARRIRESAPGSPDYMDARYTAKGWYAIIDKVMAEQGCDKETAKQYIAQHFDETLYREYEDDKLERKLGNR